MTENMLKILLRVVWLLTIYWNMANALEEPQQEIFLQPRHFNPHPYAADIAASNAPHSLNGPILFPPSPAPDQEEPSNFIKVDNTNRNIGHPVDNHPYQKVARKYRFRNPGRHRGYDNRIDPRISIALANHAKKVLGNDNTYGDQEQKKYAFSYKVVDHSTGDDFSHKQSQNEGATNGEYRVKLPDGRVQIVSYTADENGYKADVKYQDDVQKPRQKTFLQQLPVAYTNRGDVYEQPTRTDGNDHRLIHNPTPLHSFQENSIHEYDYDRKNFYSAVPTEPKTLRPVYPNYSSTTHPQTIYADLNIKLDDAREGGHHRFPVPKHRFRIIPQDKVEIVNQGVAAVGSTVTPAYLENPGIILPSTVSPSPSFSGDYQHVFVTNIPNSYYGKK